MITVYVNELSNEKVEAIKNAITLNGGNLVESEKNAVSFECENMQLKRIICKAISRAKM